MKEGFYHKDTENINLLRFFGAMPEKWLAIVAAALRAASHVKDTVQIALTQNVDQKTIVDGICYLIV